MRAWSQSEAVFARTAPEVRGDPHSAQTWTQIRRRLLPLRTYSDLAGALRLTGTAAFLVAFAAIFVHFARDNVQAADAAFRPWTEGRLPLFALDSLGGERSDLARLCKRVTLVHFFATWCEPCRAELSALQQLHDRLHGSAKKGVPKDRSVQIIGVDVGEIDNRVRRFFAERPVSFPILLDRERAMSKAWQVSVLPTTFLLDGDLVPRLAAEGDVDWAHPEIEASVMTFVRQQGGAGKDDCAF
jgi:thiol-disulfide isomerase/thioredoxin